MKHRPIYIGDERRKLHAAAEAWEAIPCDGTFANEAELQQFIDTRPLPRDFNKPETYFVPSGYLTREKPLTILVDWYILAHGLWQDVVVKGVVMEGDPLLVVDFRKSYVGWCQAHGISPEQGVAWDAIYRNIRLLGYENAPTLEFFLRMRSSPHCIVNGGD